MAIDYTRVHSVTLMQANEADELEPTLPVLKIQVVEERAFLTVEEVTESDGRTIARQVSTVGVNLQSLRDVLNFASEQSDSELERIEDQTNRGEY